MELSKLGGLDVFLKFNFPKNDWAITGGSVLAIRSIRETQDLDIIVSQELYETIKTMDEFEEIKALSGTAFKLKGFEIEVFDNMWPLFITFNEVIDRSNTIKEVKVVSLELIKDWKIKLGRDKDKNDVVLIDEYFSK